MRKNILVVTHHTALRKSRVQVLERDGYCTASADSAEEAMRRLAGEHFDLVVIGRKSQLQGLAIDQQIREHYPGQIILQIDPGSERSPYISRIVPSHPLEVLAAVKELLADH